ncbi:MAG: starch synthase, partial [Deltaproteobacteria bacterium]
PEDLSGKALCNEELLRTLRLPEGLKARTHFGMVSRLVRQIGLDLLLPLIPRMMAEGVGLVVLGTGEERYEKGLRRLAAEHPAGMRVVIDFDEGLSHKIEAGCDLYLMPSLYEPCGLNQMYSLRYGTLPVVRDTGGLADTVEQADPRTGRGTGFKFRLFRPAYLWRAIRRGLRAYATPDLWGRLQRQAMTKDFSWRRSAEQYLKLYRRLCTRSG